MSKTAETCGCDEKIAGKPCPACRESGSPHYWCDTCERVVADKRCPLCGLKARRIRQESPQ